MYFKFKEHFLHIHSLHTNSPASCDPGHRLLDFPGELLPGGQQDMERLGSHDITQRDLGDHLCGLLGIVHLDDRINGTVYAKVHNCIHGDRHRVLGEHVLRTNVDDIGSHIHPVDVIDAG